MSTYKNHYNLSNHAKNLKNLTESDGDRMTFGPNDAWKEGWTPIWRWCQTHDSDDTFKLLIDAFNLQSKNFREVPFRDIVDILSLDHSLTILKSWASTDSHCGLPPTP